MFANEIPSIVSSLVLMFGNDAKILVVSSFRFLCSRVFYCLLGLAIMFRSKRPRSQSASPSKIDHNKCGICEKAINDDDALECMWCEMVQHRTCSKISLKPCTILAELTSIVFFLL